MNLLEERINNTENTITDIALEEINMVTTDAIEKLKVKLADNKVVSVILDNLKTVTPFFQSEWEEGSNLGYIYGFELETEYYEVSLILHQTENYEFRDELTELETFTELYCQLTDTPEDEVSENKMQDAYDLLSVEFMTTWHNLSEFTKNHYLRVLY